MMTWLVLYSYGQSLTWYNFLNGGWSSTDDVFHCWLSYGNLSVLKEEVKLQFCIQYKHVYKQSDKGQSVVKQNFE